MLIAAGGFNATTTWTFVLVTITFMMYLYIGWRSRIRETQGLYVAGRGVPALANGAATAADWMSAASFLGMAGLISFMGSDGSIYLMGWTGGYVLLALLLAPYLRKFGKYTVPDFVGERYYSETARVVAAICAIFVSLTYVAGQMRGVGIVFSQFLGVEVWIGVVVGMVIVAFFAVLGGMKGITWTQVVQFFVLILAFLIPTIALSSMLADNPVPQIGIAKSNIVNDLNELQVKLGFNEYTKPFAEKSKLDVLCITFALMAGTAGLPHVIVRFYTVPNVRAARFSAGWALLFIALLYTSAPALAMFARYNLLDTLHGARITSIDVTDTDPDLDDDDARTVSSNFAELEDTQIKALHDEVRTHNEKVKQQEDEDVSDEDRIYEKKVVYHLRDTDDNEIAWAVGWQRTGLITFDNVDNGRTIQLTSDDGKFAEATIDKDIIVLSTPEVAGMAPWVIALVATGGLAAALSTAAGLLLVISSSIAHDLYLHFFEPDAPEARRVLIGRIMIVVAIVFAGYFGINPPGFVAEVVAFAFGLAAASFFPIILLGIFYKRTNREGAISGMIIGLTFTMIYIIGCKFDVIFKVFGASEPLFGNWCFGISPQGIGAVGCLLNFAVTIIVSHLTAPPPKHVQELVESVRVPAGAIAPEAHFDESDAEADNPKI